MEVTGWVRDPGGDPARNSTFFYLGAHMPRWLENAPVPLMVSARTLNRFRRRGDDFPKARTPWALDSGGFTELSMHGGWTIGPDEYGGMVTRLMEDCGWAPDFAAPQDWMCEPTIRAKTGLSVGDHQDLTLRNYLYLAAEFPFVPWLPVLQGWALDDYLTHVEAYEAAGVDLAGQLVGVGSICRRGSARPIVAILGALHARGVSRLHGFGVKTDVLELGGHLLEASDSLAWSSVARLESVKLPGCEHRGPCNNCMAWALAWREKVLGGLRTPKQGLLAL